MTRVETSMVAFGLYLVAVVGLGLMAVPHVLLPLFGLSGAEGGWIRMVGFLAAIIGAYYILSARAGIVEIAHWSVPLRLCAAGFMVLLVVLGEIGPGLLIFAAIDLAAAGWTGRALRAAAP